MYSDKRTAVIGNIQGSTSVYAMPHAPILRLFVNFSEAARGEISLRRWSASGGSIRGAVLSNQTSVNG